MKFYVKSIRLDQPAKYVIQVQGQVVRDMSDWFLEGVSNSYEPASINESKPGITTIQGVLADQSALHGLLNYIRDLGLILLFVDCLDARAGEQDRS